MLGRIFFFFFSLGLLALTVFINDLLYFVIMLGGKTNSSWKVLWDRGWFAPLGFSTFLSFARHQPQQPSCFSMNMPECSHLTELPWHCCPDIAQLISSPLLRLVLDVTFPGSPFLSIYLMADFSTPCPLLSLIIPPEHLLSSNIQKSSLFSRE